LSVDVVMLDEMKVLADEQEIKMSMEEMMGL
jgi:hypothetical protein